MVVVPAARFQVGRQGRHCTPDHEIRQIGETRAARPDRRVKKGMGSTPVGKREPVVALRGNRHDLNVSAPQPGRDN